MLKNIVIIAFVCTLFLSCEDREWHLHKVHGTTLAVDSNLTANQDISALIAPYKVQLDIIMDEVLCYSKTSVKHSRPESPLGNFVADLSFSTLTKNGLKLDMCLLNHYGLRAELIKGNITRRNAYQLMPFENELVVITMDSKAMQEMFAYLKNSEGHPIANAQLKFSNQKDHIIIDDQAWDEKKAYRVLTTDYLAKGGDNMTFFKEGKMKRTGIKLRDAIITFMTAQDTIRTKVDGRFSIID